MILCFLHPNGSIHSGLSGWLPKQVWSSSKVSQEPGNQFQCAEGLSRACFCPAVFIEHPEPDFWNSGRLTFQIKECFGYPPTEPLKKKKKGYNLEVLSSPKKNILPLASCFPFLSSSFLPSFSVVFERTLSPDCFSVLCIIRGRGDISIKGKPHWEEFSNIFGQNQNIASPKFQLLTFVAIPGEKKFWG